MIQELSCLHQYYPFYHSNGKYCLHCGKWKTLPNQVSFYVRPIPSHVSITIRGDYTGLIKSIEDAKRAFKLLGDAMTRTRGVT